MRTSFNTSSVSEHPHFALSRRLWDAIATADVETLREVLAPETVWHMPGHSPLAGTYVGIDAVLDFLARVGELSDDLRADLVDVFVSERGAVLRYAIEAHRGSHALEIEQIFVTRIEQGCVVEAIFTHSDQERYDRFWQLQ